VQIEPADDVLPLVLADPVSLERILTNLLSNALKYSRPETPITVRLEPRDDELVIAVADEGPGIPADELGHVFEPHYQARAGRSRREGLGLGLYSTRGLIQAHGGRIWVESDPAQGSVFSFSLPVA
jgi:signal transduction histidine kinase